MSICNTNDSEMFSFFDGKIHFIPRLYNVVDDTAALSREWQWQMAEYNTRYF